MPDLPRSSPRLSAKLMTTLYWTYGLNLREVGAIFGLSYHTVRDKFALYRIAMRRPGPRLYEQRPYAVRHALTLWDRGMTVEAIASATKIDLDMLKVIVLCRAPRAAGQPGGRAGSRP